MTQTIKNLFSAVFLGCLLLVSSSDALCSQPDYCGENCECGADCFCHFPNDNPCCRGFGEGFTFTGEFLWWKPCFNGLDWALKFDQTIPTPPADIYSKGEYLEVQHEWAPGFRLGLEVEGIWCDWDLYVYYTWISGKENNSANNNTGTLVSTLFNAEFNNAITTPSEIAASHSYRYQTFDIVFGQDYGISTSQYFVPYFGLQGLKLNQTWESTIDADSSPNLSMRWDSCYEALGIEVGVDYHYFFNPCLEFFTNAKFAVVGGSNTGRNSQDYEFYDEGPLPEDRIWVFKTDDAICTPGFHFQAGLNYTHRICHKELLVFIGYEFVQWFNMPQIRRFPISTINDVATSTSPNGSKIGFHGLMIGAGISL